MEQSPPPAGAPNHFYYELGNYLCFKNFLFREIYLRRPFVKNFGASFSFYAVRVARRWRDMSSDHPAFSKYAHPPPPAYFRVHSVSSDASHHVDAILPFLFCFIVFNLDFCLSFLCLIRLRIALSSVYYFPHIIYSYSMFSQPYHTALC